MSLFHTCVQLPEHRAWGLYVRSRAARSTKPFLLSIITFNHANAVAQGIALQKNNPTTLYSVCGAPTAASLPDKYTP